MIQQHAMVYEGDIQVVLPEQLQKTSPDVQHIVTESFTIADARRLKEIAYQRPQSAAYVDIVVVAGKLLREAQNALLKILEEPPLTTRIHIVLPTADSLLPTVLSRVQVIKQVESETTLSPESVFMAFAKSHYKDRLVSIDTHHKKKDQQFFATLFQEAEVYAATVSKTEPSLVNFVVESRRLLQSPGASKKMLSEELALLLPYQP